MGISCTQQPGAAARKAAGPGDGAFIARARARLPGCAWLLAGILWLAAPSAWADTGKLSGAAPAPLAKGIAAAVYLDDWASPAAIVRVRRIYPDHQRMGFFRIGVLPQVICEDVVLELHSTVQLGQTLARVRKSLKPHTGNAVLELRRVAFVFPPETQPRLQAGAVRIPEAGPWQLVDVAFPAGQAPERAARGRLQVAGPQSGWLSWESGGRGRSTNLFDLAVSANHKSREVQ